MTKVEYTDPQCCLYPIASIGFHQGCIIHSTRLENVLFYPEMVLSSCSDDYMRAAPDMHRPCGRSPSNIFGLPKTIVINLESGIITYFTSANYI